MHIKISSIFLSSIVLLLVCCNSPEGSKQDPNKAKNDQYWLDRVNNKQNRQAPQNTVECQFENSEGLQCVNQSIPGTVFCSLHEYVRCGYYSKGYRCNNYYNKQGKGSFDDAVCKKHRNVSTEVKKEAYNNQIHDHIDQVNSMSGNK